MNDCVVTSSGAAKRNGVENQNQTVVKDTDGGSSSDPASGTNDGPCTAFLKFMECNLVVDLLMQHLNFKDMKAFSLVSKDMLVAVRSSREFSKRSRLRISNGLVSSGVNLENLCNNLFKKISLDLSLPVGVIDLVSDKLEYVQSLWLIPNSAEDLHNHTSSDVAKLCVRIHEILRKATNLRELDIEGTYLAYPLEETFSSRNTQHTISNLESLIVACGTFWIDGGESNFQHNLLQLSRSPLKLKKLEIRYQDTDSFRFDCVPKLIEACKETLQELQLGLDGIWNLDEMNLIRCPKLRRFTVYLSEDTTLTEVENVATFVQNQNMLDEVGFNVSCIVSEILERMEGRLSKVRILSIMFFDLPEDEDGELALNWTFLETMTKLEEFDAELPDNLFVPKMMDSLPSSVKKVVISFLNACQDFWSCKRHLEDFSPNIGNHLRRPKDLTHFSLYNCKDAINDVGLQTVIKTCQNLKVLRFENCPNLSDFGISGVAEDERKTGVPLSHLKDLVELRISRCDLLSTRCVLNVIRFKNLRRFSFDTLKENRIQDKEQCVTQLREQNPSLVSFRHNGIYWI